MRAVKIKFVAFLFLFIGGLFSTFSQHDLTGYWEDNYGMHYYVRHINNTIYWFGEHKDGIWSGAFKGTISGNTSESIFGNRPISINGNVYDLPKGKANTQAQLGLSVLSGTEMRKTSGPFSATVFKKKTKPRNLPDVRSSGFSNSGLDGLWYSNTGGVYYMRQIGNIVVWFGEKYENSKPTACNVAFGTRTGNTITLDWADVPKGNTIGSGNLTLQVNGNRLTKTNSSNSNFASTSWIKSKEKELNVSILNAILQAQASQIRVHLNNYDPLEGSDRWFKRNDAYVTLPTAWGGRYPVNIPEIVHEGPFRNYYYYVQDLNSSPNGITAEITAKQSIGFSVFNNSNGSTQKQPIIKIAIRLETDGTEIKGRCGGKSDDAMAPDVHISKLNDSQFPIIYIYIPLEVNRGRISYGEISTYFDANIQAGGICKIADALCNKITNYRTTIISEIDKGFKNSFNSAEVRRNFENSINAIVPAEVSGSISKLVLEGDKIVFEYN